MKYSLSKLYILLNEKIEEIITNTSPGAFVLDMSSSQFKGLYVGRSDEDIKEQLKKHTNSKYKWFKFVYASTPKSAFENECKMWHDFEPPDNKGHPNRPSETDWKCPRCKEFG